MFRTVTDWPAVEVKGAQPVSVSWKYPTKKSWFWQAPDSKWTSPKQDKSFVYMPSSLIPLILLVIIYPLAIHTFTPLPFKLHQSISTRSISTQSYTQSCPPTLDKYKYKPKYKPKYKHTTFHTTFHTTYLLSIPSYGPNPIIFPPTNAFPPTIRDSFPGRVPDVPGAVLYKKGKIIDVTGDDKSE